MKKLLVLTTLSLITMQGFTVWGNEETTKEPYEIDEGTFYRCFSKPWIDPPYPFARWGSPPDQSCHKKLKKIIRSFPVNGGGVTTMTDKFSEEPRKIENMSDFFREALLPQNIYLAASLTGCKDILENIDDDHINDDPNEKTRGFVACYRNGEKKNTLQIARAAKYCYKREYKKFERWSKIEREKEENSRSCFYDYGKSYEKKAKENKEEYQRRKKIYKKVYEKLKDLMANQCDNEKKAQ